MKAAKKIYIAGACALLILGAMSGWKVFLAVLCGLVSASSSADASSSAAIPLELGVGGNITVGALREALSFAPDEYRVAVATDDAWFYPTRVAVDGTFLVLTHGVDDNGDAL